MCTCVHLLTTDCPEELRPFASVLSSVHGVALNLLLPMSLCQRLQHPHMKPTALHQALSPVTLSPVRLVCRAPDARPETQEVPGSDRLLLRKRCDATGGSGELLCRSWETHSFAVKQVWILSLSLGAARIYPELDTGQSTGAKVHRGMDARRPQTRE